MNTERALARMAVSVAHTPYLRERSDWLVGPLGPLRGFCVDDEDLMVDRYFWVDFQAPLVSGSLVTVLLDTQHSGPVLAGKMLEFTRDGTPWLVCYGDRAHTKIVAVPLEHPMLKVLAIGATVSEVAVPRATPREPIPEDTIWQHLQGISAPAIREWRRRGLPKRQTLRAVNNQASVQLLRSALCHRSFTLTY